MPPHMRRAASIVKSKRPGGSSQHCEEHRKQDQTANSFGKLSTANMHSKTRAGFALGVSSSHPSRLHSHSGSTHTPGLCPALTTSPMDRSASSSAAPLQREKLAEAKRRLMALEQSVEESSSIPAPHAAAGSGLSGASDGSSRATSDLPGACDGIEGSGSGGWNSRGAAGMHDMLAGIDEMRRLQGAVETTFTVLHDVIKAQGAAIRALQKEVPGKGTTVHCSSEPARRERMSFRRTPFRGYIDSRFGH